MVAQAVGNALTCGNFLHVGDVAAHCHGRFKPQVRGGHLGKRREAVEGQAAAHAVDEQALIGLPAVQGGGQGCGRVGQVHELGGQTRILRPGDEALQNLQLLRGFGAEGFVGHGQVAEDSLHADQALAFQLGGAGHEGRPLFDRGAVAAQAGIGRQMHDGALAGAFGGGGNRLQVPAGDAQANALAQGRVKVGGGGVQPGDEGGFDTVGTQLQGLVDVHETEHVGAGGQSGTSHRVGTVAVGVRLDDGDEHAGANQLLEAAHVVLDGVEVNVRGAFLTLGGAGRAVQRCGLLLGGVGHVRRGLSRGGFFRGPPRGGRSVLNSRPPDVRKSCRDTLGG